MARSPSVNHGGKATGPPDGYDTPSRGALGIFLGKSSILDGGFSVATVEYWMLIGIYMSGTYMIF